MEQDRISTRQLGALLWAGLMAPAAELLPAVTLPLAGRAAWLSALAALPVVLLIISVFVGAYMHDLGAFLFLLIPVVLCLGTYFFSRRQVKKGMAAPTIKEQMED